MKKLLVMGWILMLSLQSQALVADRFNCTIEIKDLESKASTKQTQEFFIARLPLSTSPAPDVRLTASSSHQSLTMETDKATFGAYLNFYFNHAIRIDSSGKPIEARQLTCSGLGGSYCTKHGGGGIGLCSSPTVIACLEPHDPFDGLNGWAPSPLVGDIPSFNEHTLNPESQFITDDQGIVRGLINLTCKYLGTYQ